VARARATGRGASSGVPGPATPRGPASASREAHPIAAAEPTASAEPAPYAEPELTDGPAAERTVVANDLTRIFEDTTAVAGVSFDVRAGSIFGIIGPSGSGKTTTLRMVMGSIAPTRGSVHVLGEEPHRFTARTREQIGYMPQQFILYPDLSARENVDFVGSLFGLLIFRRRRRVREVLQLLDLWDARNRHAKALSGGMQRRLELACALVHEPKLLILDEPTAGLDPLLRLRVWQELHRLREAGVTVVVTTQYVTEIEECDRVALLSGGRLIALDSPAGLRRSAFGGDIVEIETTDTFDAAVLPPDPRVQSIRQTGLREFRVAVDEAATSLPDLVDAVTAAGGDVATAREVRPSFDEVFAELVKRGGAKAEPATADQAVPEGMPPAGDGAPPAPDETAAVPAADPLEPDDASKELPRGPA
jgi:ABC-2 type transport system ATP-binding protein